MSLHADVAHKRRLEQAVIVSRIAPLVTILGLPVVAFIAFPTKLVQATDIDPWIYLAYINDFGMTAARFGMTYYGDRIAYIMVGKIFYSLLGPINGYFGFAYFLLVAAAASLYSVGNRFYGGATGFASACWLCLLPWLPLSIFHTYVDGAATVYLLIAIALLIVPVRWRMVGHALAGAVLALAVNCNFLLFVIGLTFAPGWLYLHQKEGLRWLVIASLTIIVGFVATYLGLGALMYIASGGRLPFFFDVTAIRTSMSLLGGRAATWFVPLHVLLSNPSHYYLLIPPTLLCVVAVVTLRSLKCPLWRNIELKSPLPFFATMHLALVILSALILHEFFAVAWLNEYFYMIYFLPGCGLALVCVVGEVDALRYFRSSRILPLATACIIIGLLLFEPVRPRLLQEISTARTLGGWCFLAGLTIAVAVIAGRSLVLNALVVVLLVGDSLAFYANSGYFALINTSTKVRQEEWDQYSAALFLQRYVNSNVPPSTPVRFWYRSRAPETTWLDGVQSTFLWGFTRAASFSANDPGMPVVNAAFRTDVSGAGALVLLGENAAELDSAESALSAAQVPFTEVNRSSFVGYIFSLYVGIMLPRMAHARSLSLDNVSLGAEGAKLDHRTAGLAFSSLPAPWSYIGRVPLLVGCIRGGGWLAADIHVTHGTVGVGVLNRKGTNFVASGSVGAGAKTQTVLLWLDSFAAAGDFVLRNWDEQVHSTGMLKGIRVGAESTVNCGAMPSHENTLVRSVASPPAETTEAMPSDLLAGAVQIYNAFGLPLKPGSKSKLSDALPTEIATPPQPWAYAAEFPVHKRALTGPIWIHIHINVKAGPIGIGVLNRAGNGFLTRVPVKVAGDTTITLAVAQEQIGDLIVQSWDEGKPGDVIVYSLTVLGRHSPPTAHD